MKKLAFTLAEVLITLAIVGVVAVLTIPTVTNNMSQRSNIVKLEATIKSLNDAINNLMIDERVTDIADSSLFDDTSIFFTQYLKSSSNCDDDNFTSCFAESYHDIDGGILDPFKRDFENNDAMLPNGAAVQILGVYDSNSALLNNGFLIDVNGPKGPNIAGRDLFMVRLFTDGTVGSDSADLDEELILKRCKNGYAYGLECVYLLETNGWVMDY